ncbi:acyl-CoA dehydrogenase family protein [Streptomyces sp. NPDC090088]|uniref:acyl-CoA dehydrogenase family protein n=1 Tax=Streptomyces sp. NPDC090088 TaxID=3365944 RepID=UPI003818EEDF
MANRSSPRSRSDCLQAALEYTDSRVQFGRPISVFRLTQKKPADMAVSWGRSALLTVHLGWLKGQGRIWPEQVSVGKLNNVREALAIARERRMVFGANGISLECSPLRHALSCPGCHRPVDPVQVDPRAASRSSAPAAVAVDR